MAKISGNRKDLVMFPLCALFLFLGVITAQATTYYVATTGDDNTGDGSAANPWRNPGRCFAPGTPLVAGDTCTVGNGTYTDTFTNGTVILIGENAPIGTSSKPITVRSTNPSKAKLIVPNSRAGATNNAVYVSRPYYIIEGFDIDGTGSSNNPALFTAHHGVWADMGATGLIIRNNLIHHISRTLCSDSAQGNTGIYLQAGSVVVDTNRVYSIGRLRNGESGCSTKINGNDHGVYIEAASNPTVHRNVFYDTNRGWPIHVYKSGGGTTTDLTIYNNTFADRAPDGTSPPPGHILLQSTIFTANIKNNISYNAYIGMVHCANSVLTATNVTISHNLSSNAIQTTACDGGVTFSNNLTSTPPGFLDAGARNYQLTANSAAINAGVNVGLPFDETAPDIGAYEYDGLGGTPPAIPMGLSIQ